MTSSTRPPVVAPRRQRGRQAGDAGADDDDVGLRRPAGLGREQPVPQRQPAADDTAITAGHQAAAPKCDEHVVDQPGGADPGGDREQRLAREVLGHSAQVYRVDEGEVVERRRPARAASTSCGRRAHGRRAVGRRPPRRRAARATASAPRRGRPSVR